MTSLAFTYLPTYLQDVLEASEIDRLTGFVHKVVNKTEQGERTTRGAHLEPVVQNPDDLEDLISFGMFDEGKSPATVACMRPSSIPLALVHRAYHVSSTNQQKDQLGFFGRTATRVSHASSCIKEPYQCIDRDPCHHLMTTSDIILFLSVSLSNSTASTTITITGALHCSPLG